MKSLKPLAFAMVGVLLLSACGMIGDMSDALEKSEAIAVELEKEIGTKPFVGWNINNGTLTNVTVTFPIEGVSKLTIGELDAKVRVVVARSFDKPLEQLIVSTISTK